MSFIRSPRRGWVAVAGAALMWCGTAFLAAQPAGASTSASTSATPTPSASTAPCPPAPPGNGKTDYGFPEVGPVTTTQGGVPVVTQPIVVKLICYDAVSQHASVSFSGTNAAGHTVDVPVLSGTTSFTFVGHADPNVVDARQTYTLDLSPLGAAGSSGWHLQVSVVITDDPSASRTAPFIILPATSPSPTPTPTSPTPTPTTPSPTVSPTQASRAPTPTPTTSVLAVHATRSLPFTGGRLIAPLLILGTGLVVVGAIALARGRRPHRR